MRESRSLDASQHRLIEGARRKSRDAGVRIGGISDRLRALDPKRVLARGYSITRTEDGRVLRGRYRDRRETFVDRNGRWNCC